MRYTSSWTASDQQTDILDGQAFWQAHSHNTHAAAIRQQHTPTIFSIVLNYRCLSIRRNPCCLPLLRRHVT